MIYPCLSQVLDLHAILLERTGGLSGILDKGLLESALASPFHTFGGRDLYPSFEEKIAVMCYSIIRNHPFLDGNKRVGIGLLLCLFELNGLKTSFTDDDWIRFGFSIADGTMNFRQLVDEILSYRC
jgi:death-on-curing protein